MTTLIKIIVTLLTSLMLLSCNFDMNFDSGVKGNGNVYTEDRNINQDFKAIKASHGLDVYITQSNENKVKIQADENLHELIITEIENGVLKIYSEKNIGNASSKKILVNFKDLDEITSTSGSDVFGTNIIKTETLELNTTSGSDMELEVLTTSLNCESTSGSDLEISGKTEKLYASATSGSDIKAAELIAQTSHVKATSGAGITVNTAYELNARASSGGDITYYGDPKVVSKKDGVSGSINKR